MSHMLFKHIISIKTKKYPGVKSDVHTEMKMVSLCTSGSTNDEQGSLNVASEENSPTPRSLNKSRLKMDTSIMLDTGFVLFSGLKIQGLFKDIPGRNSNFSSTQSCKKMPLECDTR